MIVWDKDSTFEFGEVEPGESGQVSFSLRALSQLSREEIIRNPELALNLSAAGTPASLGDAAREIYNADARIIRLISKAGLSSKAVYYSGPFKNSGPIPPKANQETTYTVVWSVTNVANPLSGVKVSASLPPGVRFVGTSSPASAEVDYSSREKTVTWNVGKVGRGTGVTTLGKEAFFQVALTPSLSQVGASPDILNDSVLTGHDDFANVDIRINRPGLTTLLADPAAPRGSDRVME